MKLFIDTSALFAVLVRNDYMNVRATASFKALVAHSANLCTTNYVLLETMALLQARVGLDAARRFHHDFVPALNVHWVDEKLHEKALRRLDLRGRRAVSLVDCTSFVWMEENALTHAFAYDEHFSEEGFVVIGTGADVERHIDSDRR